MEWILRGWACACQGWQVLLWCWHISPGLTWVGLIALVWAGHQIKRGRPRTRTLTHRKHLAHRVLRHPIMSESPGPIDPSTGKREARSRKGFLANAWRKLKFWKDRDPSPEDELALEPEKKPRFILPCRKGKWKKKRQKIQMRNMQKRQTALQLRQDELLKYQRQVAGLHDPIHLIVKSNPVIYHVDYSDITTVGKIKRRRNRSYVYQSDHDFVRRDWEKAMDRHAQNYPVMYNRSAIKGIHSILRGFEEVANLPCSTGTTFGVKLRPIRDGRGWFFWRKKPAKIRVQKLRILKEHPAHPHRLSIYKIRKKSKYPSVVVQRRAERRRQRHFQRYQEQYAYPPIHMHYYPMHSPAPARGFRNFY